MDGPQVRPLPFVSALLYFGIPSVIAAIIVYGVMPRLAALGFPIFFNYLLVYATAPMLALLVASQVAYQREGRALSWSGITDTRFLRKNRGVANRIW